MTAPALLDDWTALVCAELGLDPEAVPIAALLDTAKVVAHGVARPAAPLTTFLLGSAVGRAVALGLPIEAATEAAVASITRLAQEWIETQQVIETQRDIETQPDIETHQDIETQQIIENQQDEAH